MNRSSVTSEVAFDRLAKVGAEEAKLDAKTAADIGTAAAALRRDGQRPELEVSEPPVVVSLDAVRPDRPNPNPGRWARIGAMAAVVLISVMTIGALSQREQAVSTEPAESPGASETSVIELPADEIPSSTLVVESGPTTANLTADTAKPDDTSEPDETAELGDDVEQSSTTVREENAVSSAAPESTTSTAKPTEPTDDGSTDNTGDGLIRLAVGEAGTVDLKIVDNMTSVAAVDASEGWTHTSGPQPDDEGHEVLFNSPDDASAWLKVRSTTSQFNLEIEQQGGTIYRFDRRQTRAFEIGQVGQAGRATLQHDVTGLVGLDVEVNEGWTLSASTTAFNEIRLHLRGPANGYRTSTEIRVGDLLIFITSSDL